MDEARKLKSILYPLSRDVRNLRTFITNINNILQAEPQRFAVAAPVGLMSLRNSVRTLNKTTRATKEVNDIALQESTVAASLAAATHIPMLRPSQQLNQLARNIKPQVDRAYSSVVRIDGYLNPMFVFMAAMIPIVENMLRDVSMLDEKLLDLKKAVSRLVDQELTSGLPAAAEKQMELMAPQLSVIEDETADIAAQVGLLMGKLNKLSELSSKLEVLVRMSAAMENAMVDLVPSIASLKNLGNLLVQVQKTHDPVSSSLTDHVVDALAAMEIPNDMLVKLETQLSRHVEQFIDPVVGPLHELAEQLRQKVMTTHELNGLESTTVAQNIRFGNVTKLLSRLFDQLDRVIEDVKQAMHAA